MPTHQGVAVSRGWLASGLMALSVVLPSHSVSHVTARIDVHPEGTYLMPLQTLPLAVQERFACVAWAESRDKLVDTSWAGAEGEYQLMPYEWKFARANIKGLPATPNEASLYQQQEVVVFYYHRNGGLYPEWQDGC
jgi:hypothetical protein